MASMIVLGHSGDNLGGGGGRTGSLCTQGLFPVDWISLCNME